MSDIVNRYVQMGRAAGRKKVSRRWEYKVLYHDIQANRAMEQELASAGADGWELVSAVMENKFEDDTAINLFMKRMVG